MENYNVLVNNAAKMEKYSLKVTNKKWKQFKVKLDDYNIVKGDIPIFIGTTREPVELLIISANSLAVVDERFPARRGSTSSTHSDCSGLTHFTLPPAYSQLSSRVPSLETCKMILVFI